MDLTDFAKGIATFNEVATEAAVVYILTSLLQYAVLLACVIFCCLATKRSLKWLGKTKNEDEKAGATVATVFLGGLSIILIIGSLATFPAKEIVGVFVPRGYVVVQTLDKISEHRK